MSIKPTLVLLHGAFQDGPSNWHKVAPELDAEGYKVIIVTLPGRNDDSVDPQSLTTATYRDTVLATIDLEAEPVILVGHSFGRITISNVAESSPDKIKALVYLSAYLPQDGESLLALAQVDRDSYLGKPGNLEFTPDYALASIKEDQKSDIFANDAVDADRQAIVASLIPEPAGPQGMPVQLTAANFGRVPKFYLQTTLDHTVSPFLQVQMIAHTPVVKVTQIEAGHAAYITQPKAVVAAILDAATH